MDCLFCKIANKEIDSKILYEDEKYLAFLDIDQSDAEGHTLIIPKQHVKDYTELDKETLHEMFAIAQKLVPFLMERLNKKACTLLFNYGDSQMIKHVHLHILPDFQFGERSRSQGEIYELLKDENTSSF